MRANLEFPGWGVGGGGGGSWLCGGAKQKTCGRSIDIFWNCTLINPNLSIKSCHFCFQPNPLKLYLINLLT